MRHISKVKRIRVDRTGYGRGFHEARKNAVYEEVKEGQSIGPYILLPRAGCV